MAGTRISVLPKTTYNYLSLGASMMAPITEILKGFDVASYRESTLLVRVHNYTIAQAGAYVAIGAGPIWQSPEDPTGFFTTPGGPTAVIQVNNTLTAPLLISVPIPSPFGPTLWVAVTAMQASTAGTLSATVSIDLSVKV